ncbi:GAF domain-containing protein [Scytonema sp. UIC 10036]|uniref:ATP-binding protein n=1 Tax=Scytonema sp. UIC 10036 TaxID=2304196 RepID=UPI0012DABEE5|nr:ATP-binding protein [Scytonema sp. UIC 10036]MUG99083.1 GAF domain-containing protein [Scytonema sp. UIC 10036]
MNTSEIITASNVDLTNCDREQIHIPGSIQPHGLLLVLQLPEFTIRQVSSNSQEILGIPPQQLLQKKIIHLLGNQQIQAIQQCLSRDFENINPLKLSIKNQDKSLLFDGVLHVCGQDIILELEPTTSEATGNFFDFYQWVKKPITKMQKANTLDELCEVIVQEVRQITGFERVMVYRFDADGAGTVIAESKAENCTPYIGLRYPATDIPKPARRLYHLNLLRLIPNVNYQPVELVPIDNLQTNQRLDLSLSVLRSVSPLHIEYLRNMSVGASMSISLIKDNNLWGLIACHHKFPKYINYEIRTICEFLGQAMALELRGKEENENLEYKLKLKSIQTEFVDRLSQAENLVESLVADRNSLLEMVGAQGVALYLEAQLFCIGKTPEETEIHDLIDWVSTKIQRHIFSTDCLPKIYPPAENFKNIASGLLVISLSQIHQSCILWFRPEVIQTVSWGGNPNKTVTVEEDGNMRISPRKSFAIWQETRRCTSLTWQKCEIDSALELRSAIVGILLHKIDELVRMNIQLERSNQELDAFAYIASHDLKEPLRGIHNYSSLLIEDYADVLNEDAVAKLQILTRLTQRMEDLIESLLHFSRLGRMELNRQPTDLNELIKNVLEIQKTSIKMSDVEIYIPQTLPTIICDSSQVDELFSNLISNAIKYNDKTQKLVEIGYLEVASPSSASNQQIPIHLPSRVPVFYVRDNGIGIPEQHLEMVFRIFKRLHPPRKYGGGTGAGLTIAKKIVERHGGKIWVESSVDVGSTFYFTLQSEEELNAG